jgi:hypothetical protein
VFAADFAHIHYLHNGSFGNSDAPAVRGMRAESDAWGVHASFCIQNKPVSWLWEWSRVPEVEVHAQALLPSTSVVAFELVRSRRHGYRVRLACALTQTLFSLRCCRRSASA